MKHIKLFENFINEWEDIYIKNPKTKGLSFVSGSDFGSHYIIIDYKKPFFRKAALSNGRHKFTFVETGKRPRRGRWFDENKKEVTDDNLLDDLTYLINAVSGRELQSLSSGS